MTEPTRFEGTQAYIATEDLKVAVNAAVTLRRPLLVKGEPGTGKTVLAHEISKALDAPLITLLVQDWGSMFGLRTWADEPDWFRRVICANGALPNFSPGPNPFAPLIVDEVNYNCDDGRIFIEMGFERAANTPCSREDDRCHRVCAVESGEGW